MPFEVGRIPGVTGPVFSDFSFWNGLFFTVEGQRLKPRGLFRRRVTLPGIPENVEGTLKAGLPGSQRLVVAGTAYRIAPDIPRGLQILAVLPLLLGLLVKGGLAWVVVAVALGANTKAVTSTLTNPTKTAVLIATFLAGAAANVALATALHAAWWQ